MSAREVLDAYAYREEFPRTGFRGNHAPKAFAALRRVLSLHPRDDNDNCVVCFDPDGNWPLAFPCPTVREIEEALKP